VEVFKDADGDDTDSDFEDPETTSPSSSITYRVIIDNDLSVPVTITSLSDDIYDPVTCKDSSNMDVVGQTLGPDDGDDAPPDGGDDEIICTFVRTAPDTIATVVDTVTVEFQKSGGGTGQASDSATVDTGPVGGVVELQVASGAEPQSASQADGSTAGRGYGLLMIGIATGALMAALAARYAWRRSLR
jgi:hypothetical protein